ncbi:MAG TPA: ABC transporter substrate-binding protein [Clostridiaceae bacterium]|nr:ABC transporter substrate-binding protein [Clostridiaceae bacterium]
MKETIYTIPVTEAFSVDCECPMCLLEKDCEEKSVEYFLGPSLMEPDVRIETNKKGFCKRHYELMYIKKANQLGLGLMIDTHLCEKNALLNKVYAKYGGKSKKETQASLLKRMTSKSNSTEVLVDNLINEIDSILASCIICEKINYTMDKFIDVILYLYFHETDFQKIFQSKKGFCLKHLRMLLEGGKKHLNTRQLAVFTENLMTMELENLNRIQEEVNWFTKKFDYKNKDKPWGNSKDSLSRAIEKITGYCKLV